jgi:hypothetical protein
MSDETNSKIANELQEYIKYKKKFVFKQLPLEDINGTLFCAGFPLYDAEGKLIGECEKWINVGIMIKSPLSRILSNLFPYDFDFRGFQLKSLEGFFQGIKFKNPEVQKYVFSYSTINAYYMKAASDYNWQDSGNIYWQGTPVKRDSEEYTRLVDELYISAAQNPLFRQALKNVNRPLIHSIGNPNKNETVLTRFEYEFEINCLSSFLKEYDARQI